MYCRNHDFPFYQPTAEEMPLITDNDLNKYNIIGWKYHEDLRDIPKIKDDNRKAQRDADKEVLAAAKKELRLEFADWLEVWMTPGAADGILTIGGNYLILFKARIASLRGKKDKQGE